MFLEQLVRAPEDLLERMLQVAVFPDVPEEFFGEQLLAGRQIEHARLLAEMVDQVARLDRDGLDVLSRVAVAAAGHTVLGPVVEQDVLPVGLVVARLLLLGLLLLLLLLGRGRLHLFFRLHHFEERIAQQLLLQVLLQIEQRHIEQIHRLVEARVDPQVLAERRVLMQAGLHAAGDRRARRRVVRVGPR